MQITIPTVEEMVSKYGTFFDNLNTDEALETRTKELEAMKKEELVQLVLSKETRKDSKPIVQDLAKAMLKDEDLIAANYEQIAEAIKVIMPDAKTSSKSIASYVSKKKKEWDLPARIRISQ